MHLSLFLRICHFSATVVYRLGNSEIRNQHPRKYQVQSKKFGGSRKVFRSIFLPSCPRPICFLKVGWLVNNMFINVGEVSFMNRASNSHINFLALSIYRPQGVKRYCALIKASRASAAGVRALPGAAGGKELLVASCTIPATRTSTMFWEFKKQFKNR